MQRAVCKTEINIRYGKLGLSAAFFSMSEIAVCWMGLRGIPKMEIVLR
jgi:hypothetical protein